MRADLRGEDVLGISGGWFPVCLIRELHIFSTGFLGVRLICAILRDAEMKFLQSSFSMFRKASEIEVTVLKLCKDCKSKVFPCNWNDTDSHANNNKLSEYLFI